MVKVRTDLTGQKFGRLTVIRQCEDYVNPKGRHFAKYSCKCDCGNPEYVNVTAMHLKDGHTQSCGCISSLGQEKINTYLTAHNILNWGISQKIRA